MIILTTNFKLSWPKIVEDLISAIAPVSKTTDSVISLDCFLDKRSSNAEKSDLFYLKLLTQVLTPFVVLFVSFVFWFILYLLK